MNRPENGPPALESLNNKFPEWNEWHFRFHEKTQRLYTSIEKWADSLANSCLNKPKILLYGAQEFGCITHSILQSISTIDVVAIVDPNAQMFRQFFPSKELLVPAETQQLKEIDAILLATNPNEYQTAISQLDGIVSRTKNLFGLFDAADANRPPVFLSTMPKAGSNWMNLMLRELLVEGQGYTYCRTRSLSKMNISTYGWHHYNTQDLTDLPSPDTTKCIYLYRDPRDHLVSISMFYKYGNANATVSSFLRKKTELETIELFLRGFTVESDGLSFDFQSLKNTCLDVLNWLNWINKNPERGLALKYEDLVANTDLSLKLIRNFIGFDASDESISLVAKNHSFKSQTGRKPGQEKKGVHLRKGKVGDWKNHFTPKLTEEFLSDCSDYLQQLNYS